MAIVNTKSTVITNADSNQPHTPNKSYQSGGLLYSAAAMVEVAAADTDASVYRMIRVPSGARILRLEVLNDAITAGTAYDVGLYDTAAAGGLAADDAVFATSIDMSMARSLPFDAMFEVLDIDKVEKRVWELLNLSADPFKEYDLCFTADTVGSSAGTLVMRAIWTV